MSLNVRPRYACSDNGLSVGVGGPSDEHLGHMDNTVVRIAALTDVIMSFRLSKAPVEDPRSRPGEQGEPTGIRPMFPANDRGHSGRRNDLARGTRECGEPGRSRSSGFSHPLLSVNTMAHRTRLLEVQVLQEVVMTGTRLVVDDPHGNERLAVGIDQGRASAFHESDAGIGRPTMVCSAGSVAASSAA